MKLIVPTIGSSMQHNLKLRFAQAVVIDGLPLNAFDPRKDLCKALSLLNNKFHPPSAREIREKLLPGKFVSNLLQRIVLILFFVFQNSMKQLRKKLLHFFKIVISISLPTNPSIFNINKFKIYVSQLKNTVSFILNQKLYKMKHLMMNEMQNGFIKSLLQQYQKTFHKSTSLL